MERLKKSIEKFRGRKEIIMDDKIVAICAITVLCCFGTWQMAGEGVAIIASGVSAIAGLAGYSMAKVKKGGSDEAK